MLDDRRPPAVTSRANIHDEQFSLSRNQVEARKVIPRELPKFSGRPEQWPAFISAYENASRLCGFTDDENLMRLQNSLTGAALEAVTYRMLLPSEVPGVIVTLRRLYGQPEMIVDNLLEKMRSVAAPSEHLSTIVEYALAIENLTCVLVATSMHDHMQNPMLVHEAVDKLPDSMKLQWALYKAKKLNVNLSTFSAWLNEIACAAQSVIPIKYTSTFTPGGPNKHSNGGAKRSDVHVHTHVDESSIEEDLKSKTRHERWQEVIRLQICRCCLDKHEEGKCPKKRTCGVDGCERLHHPLLHNHKSTNRIQSSQAPTTAKKP